MIAGKKRKIFIITFVIIILALVCFIWLGDIYIERINTPLYGQIFDSPEVALSSYEKSEINANDSSLDFKPPYTLVDKLILGNNVVIIYTYSYAERPTDIAMLIVKNTGKGWKFTDAFCSLDINPSGKEYWQDGAYTNIKIGHRSYSLCFSFLPVISDKCISVDNIKAEKHVLTFENQTQVYLCYALSEPDNLLSNLLTPVEQRHRYELK